MQVPVLQTGRLTLNRLIAADADALHRQRSDENLMRYIPRIRTKDSGDALAMLHKIDAAVEKGEALAWAIRKTGETDMIGNIGLVHIYPENRCAELGYMLESPYHNKGLMREAIAAVLQHAFETMKLHRVEAITDPENLASNRVLENCGFKREGILRENLLWEGRYLDALYFSLLDREYFKLQA